MSNDVGVEMLFILAMLYLVPAFVAAGRHHRNMGAITVLTLLAGWTLIGWIIALVWACTHSTATAAPQSSVVHENRQ